MKKKIVTLLMAGILGCSLVACGESSKQEATSAKDQEEVSAATEGKETSVGKNSGSEKVGSAAETDVLEEVNDTEKVESFDINIDKCIEDLKAGLPLEPDYTFVRDYTILADGNDLTISIIVDDATDPESALDFADTVVRQLNLYANIQDSDVELGNKDFYGGLYTQYTVLVGVAQYSKMDTPSEWLVYDAIVGGKTMLKLQ